MKSSKFIELCSIERAITLYEAAPIQAQQIIFQNDLSNFGYGCNYWDCDLSSFVDLEELKQLLEQSTGNKFYRLGDNIVLKDQALLPDIWVVTKIHNDGHVGYKSALQGYPPPESFWELSATRDQIRHATACEIQQKKRALQEDIEHSIKSKDAFLVLYRESIHYQSLKEQHPDHSDDFICQFCAVSDDFIDPSISDAYRIFKACSYEWVEDDKAYDVAIAQLNQHNIEMEQRRIQFENGEFEREIMQQVEDMTGGVKSYLKNNKIMELKSTISNQILNALEDAYQAGQSEELKETKEQLDHTLKHAQEGYDFFKVVMNRFCMSENHLESTTKTYLREIGNQLEQIKGIKK